MKESNLVEGTEISSGISLRNIFVKAGDQELLRGTNAEFNSGAVSYTHLTLPTIYSV